MKVLVYTFKSYPTTYVANHLIESGKISAVITQVPMNRGDKMRFIAARIKRYGILKIVDEILFKIYYSLVLKKQDEHLRERYFPEDFFNTKIKNKKIQVHEVNSINSKKAKELLTQLKPDMIIMESREMIDKDVLKIPRLGFIGCHPGIIPEYRGVYASFWAMRYGELDKVGLSVYLADSGVDTGGIISQRASSPKFDIKHFKVESERLMIEGVNDLIDAIDKAEKGLLKTYKKDTSLSRFFSHIGLSDYIKARLNTRCTK